MRARPGTTGTHTRAHPARPAGLATTPYRRLISSHDDDNIIILGTFCTLPCSVTVSPLAFVYEKR